METFWTFEDMYGNELSYEFVSLVEAINAAQEYLLSNCYDMPEHVQFIENDEEGECVRVVRRLIDHYEEQPDAFGHREYGIKN